jgi:uncharacterized protein YhjY with autotransporter beta-barrel domain
MLAWPVSGLVRSVLLGSIASVLAMLPGAASAQAVPKFTDAGASFKAHVQSICPTLGAASRQGDEQDLFLRCNAVLNQPNSGISGLTSQANVLDQYVGVQNLAPQSEGVRSSNRGDQVIAARLGALAGQMRGGMAALTQPKIVLLASNDPTDLGGAAPPAARQGFDTFVSIGGFKGEQETTNRELGFDQDGGWIAGGVDYAFSPTMIGGVAASYLKSGLDFAGVGGLASGGSMDTDSWSISGYGSWLASDKLELNALVSYGQSNYDNERRIQVTDRNGGATPNTGNVPSQVATIDRVARGSTDADTYQVALGMSYSLVEQGAFSLIPMADISYYSSEIGAFSETGAAGLDLSYDKQNIDSVQASVGATASYTNSMSWGVLVPYVRARAIFELQDVSQTVQARYTAAARVSGSFFTVTTNPGDDSSFDVAVGVSALWSNGMSAFAEVGTIAGIDNVEHNTLSAGLRFEF